MNETTNIGFIGMTHLGLNSAVVAAEKNFNIIAYDENVDKIKKLQIGDTHLNEPLLKELLKKNKKIINFTSNTDRLKKCDILYIAADVQTDESGSSDLSIVKKYIQTALELQSEETIIVILSQVPPGFTRTYSKPGLRIFCQVETLIFGEAIERALNPERYIIGAFDPKLPLPTCYQELLDSHGSPPIYQMSYESAELAKISINCFLAAAVSTTNTLAELCEELDADWSEIAPTLRLDRRIGQYAYLTPGLGLSGGNIERDIATVNRLGKKYKTNIDVSTSWLKNSAYRRNWCLKIIKKFILNINEKPVIGVLGLSYKENTNSTKNSVSIACLERLKKETIKVYDPVVLPSIVPYAKSCEDIDTCIDKSDILMIMTPWPEFSKITIETVKEKMSGRVIIDPYGCLKHLSLNNKGYKYYSLGKKSKLGNQIC
jgi:UDPglucose 6-dehydrogenase